MGTERMPLMLIISWTEADFRRDQAYGPWVNKEDLSHLDEIHDFIKRWIAESGTEPSQLTLYLVADPANHPASATGSTPAQ